MTAPPRLEGLDVAVLGAGASGHAAIRLLQARGAGVTLFEEKGAEALGTAAAALDAAGVRLRLGTPLADAELGRPDLLVVSPGVPLALPSIQRARAAGVPVWGEVELAFHFLAPVPVVGITGTNGKSTTTALCGALCAAGGLRPFVGGNLDVPLSDAALAPAPGAYVVELSSFQLEGIVSFRAHAAAILNLTPDHLDRYPSAAAYGAAKAHILENQVAGDVAVVNGMDPEVLRLSSRARVPVFGFLSDTRAAVPVGLAGWAVRSGDGFAMPFAGLAFRVGNRALRGNHNLENAMAAALLATHLGVASAAIQNGLDRFPGLPHRLESVRTLDGVEWVNDSKATNVEAAVVALQAFPAGQRLWLVAGGKGKGAPYDALRAAAGGKVAGVLTLGQDAPLIERTFSGGFEVHRCGTLERAVLRARELARPGEVVLLSPACASYDQFQNFEDRGNAFRRLVMALA